MSKGRWLFGNQNDFLTHYARPENYTDVRRLRTLKVQVFIFHQNRLLLLRLANEDKPIAKPSLSSKKAKGKEDIKKEEDMYTAPSKLIPHSPSSPQTLYKIVLRMLRQPIEENKLLNLHFLDIHVGNEYVLEQWRAEDVFNRDGVLRLNVCVMAEGEKVDERTGIDCEGEVEVMEWFGREEAGALGLVDLNGERVGRMFGQMGKYIALQNHLDSLLNSPTPALTPPNQLTTFARLGNLTQNAIHIHLGLQTVYRGSTIPYALVLIPKYSSSPSPPLTLLDVPHSIFSQTGNSTTTHHEEIHSRIPLAGRKFKITEYVVIGKVLNGEAQFVGDLRVEMIRGLLGEEGKLRFEWLFWNEGVTLVGAKGMGGSEKKRDPVLEEG